MKSKKNNYLSVFLIIGFTLIILNYAPMLYIRITGNGASAVEFYQYKIPAKVLLDEIRNIRLVEKSKKDSVIISEAFNNYTYVRFYNEKSKKYFHIYISMDTLSLDNSTLVFYGVSDTPDKEMANRINLDFGFIQKQIYLNKFREVVLDQIKP